MQKLLEPISAAHAPMMTAAPPVPPPAVVRPVRFREQAARWCARRPVGTLWLAALAGVLLSCYPILFLGKSFVGPNIFIPLLYAEMPTLPGARDARTEWRHGTDTAAGLVASLPYAAVERRALFHDGEFPLFNRANSGGVPLLGQGQSMLGDPLHWLVLLLGGNSLAWDARFLLAKLLFAAGLGLAARTATGDRLFAGTVTAFSACFLGIFVHRFNHPATFSVCYAPWILYAWLELARPVPRPSLARWLGLLLLANWTELSSGTAKEACLLLLGLNATGAAVLLTAEALPWREKAARFGWLLWAGAGFVLASAPLWLVFLDALGRSWNDYARPHAYQLQPSLLAGLFDDIFYRQYNKDEGLNTPGTNFLVLLGLLLAVAGCKDLRRRRTFAVVAGCALVPLAFVFGVVSPRVIVALPFLANVVHIDTTFSCLLMILLPVLAGFGLQHAQDRLAARDWALDVWCAILGLGLLLGLFFGAAQAVQGTDFRPVPLDASSRRSPFFWSYAGTLVAAYGALPFLWRRFCLHRGASALGTLPWVALCLGALLWRQGIHSHAVVDHDHYVLHAPPRVDYHVPSPAVERVLALQEAQPGRTQGVGEVLQPGFGGSLGLEMVSGPDALQNRYFHQLISDSSVPFLYHWRVETDWRDVARWRPFLDMLNVRYYLDRRGPDGAPPVDQPGLRRVGRFDLDVYESGTAWPRAFFTDALAVSDGDRELLELLAAGDGLPFAAVGASDLAARPALRPLAERGAEGRAVVPATDYRLTSNTTAFRVHAPGPGVVAVMEGFQAGDTRVSVNGQPSACFRVNEAFSGVYLDRAGDYTVRFRYWPRRLTAALWMAALGVGLLGALAWRCPPYCGPARSSSCSLGA